MYRFPELLKPIEKSPNRLFIDGDISSIKETKEFTPLLPQRLIIRPIRNRKARVGKVLIDKKDPFGIVKERPDPFERSSFSERNASLEAAERNRSSPSLGGKLIFTSSHWLRMSSISFWKESQGIFFRAWKDEAHLSLWRRFLKDSTSDSLRALISFHSASWEVRVKVPFRNFSGMRGWPGMACRSSSPRISPFPRVVTPWRPVREISSSPFFLSPW